LLLLTFHSYVLNRDGALIIYLIAVDLDSQRATASSPITNKPLLPPRLALDSEGTNYELTTIHHIDFARRKVQLTRVSLPWDVEELFLRGHAVGFVPVSAAVLSHWWHQDNLDLQVAAQRAASEAGIFYFMRRLSLC